MFLKNLDIYSSPIVFLHQGHESHSTNVGLLLSAITGVLFILLLTFFSRDLMYRQNPSLFNQILFDQDNQNMNFSEGNFLNFVLQPYVLSNGVYNYTFDRSLFNIYFENISYVTLQNGTKIVSSNVRPLKNCKKSDFDPTIQDFFKKYNFETTAFCLDSKQYPLVGQFSSDVFRFLRFTLKECVDGAVDSIGVNNNTCRLRESASKEMSNWRISLFLTFASPLASNFEKNYYIQVYNQGLAMSYASFPKTNYFFRQDSLYTDTDLLVDTEGRKTSIPVYDHAESEIISNNLSQQGINFFQLYLRMNPTYYMMRISYDKIPAIFANTFSFLAPFQMLFIIITKFVSRVTLRMEVVNEIFHSEKNPPIEINMNKNKSRVELIQSNRSNKVTPLSEESDYNNIKKTVKNSGDILHLHMDTKKNRKLYQKVKTVEDELRIFPSFFNLRKRLIFKFFSDKIDEKLDLISYFKLQDEILKLKALILDNDQRNVMKLWNFGYRFTFQKVICENFEDSEHEDKIIESFLKLNAKKEKSVLDKILLKNANLSYHKS